MYFRGATALNLDAKGRMAVPSRYRDRLQSLCVGQLVLTVHYSDPCLLLYPLPEWEVLERKLTALPSAHKQVRRWQRLLMGHATECEMDGHGRILLPPLLRKTASLERSVVLVGQGNRFEVWDEVKWDEQRDEWLAENSGDELELPEELEGLTL